MEGTKLWKDGIGKDTFVDVSNLESDRALIIRGFITTFVRCPVSWSYPRDETLVLIVRVAKFDMNRDARCAVLENSNGGVRTSQSSASSVLMVKFQQ